MTVGLHVGPRPPYFLVIFLHATVLVCVCRMPTLCVRMGGVILEETHVPSEPLKDCVRHLLEAASVVLGGQPLQAVGCVFSDSNLPVENWHGGRCVGIQDIIVEAQTSQPITFVELIGSVSERQQQSEQREAIRDKRQVSNLATQVLMYACGQQSFRDPSVCSYFSSLGTGHPGVASLAQSLTTPPAVLVDQLDRVVTRRNGMLHPVDLATLNDEVDDMVQLITPSLQRLCKWECIIVQNYAAIKAAFPGNF